jgi:hypothetical protein
VTWEERAGCRNPLVDAEIFHPSTGEGMKQAAGLALHTCHNHCDVRTECKAAALENPPEVPQILGGLRWVSDGCHAAKLETRRTPHLSAGCRICREES